MTTMPLAGPCNTKDAGSGPTPGYTGQTTGMDLAKTPAHPPTDTMNKGCWRLGNVIAGHSGAAAGTTHCGPAGSGRSAVREDGGSGLLVSAAQRTS
jgi:hypothetical protein